MNSQAADKRETNDGKTKINEIIQKSFLLFMGKTVDKSKSFVVHKHIFLFNNIFVVFVLLFLEIAAKCE